MKRQALSALAIEEAGKHAHSVFRKRGRRKKYETLVHLRVDELAALLARAFYAGQRAKKRARNSKSESV